NNTVISGQQLAPFRPLPPKATVAAKDRSPRKKVRGPPKESYGELFRPARNDFRRQATAVGSVIRCRLIQRKSHGPRGLRSRLSRQFRRAVVIVVLGVA